jgi:hypothetical protein
MLLHRVGYALAAVAWLQPTAAAVVCRCFRCVYFRVMQWFINILIKYVENLIKPDQNSPIHKACVEHLRTKSKGLCATSCQTILDIQGLQSDRPLSTLGLHSSSGASVLMH